ncbi:hypothetical protein AB0B81_35670, partial [Streptomyces sp. NPDC039028]
MNLRLTWVQPEDLLGHELRQAAEDGRDARAVAARWTEAGGPPAPESAGAAGTARPRRAGRGQGRVGAGGRPPSATAGGGVRVG